MSDHIFDGKPHAFDENYGYILKNVNALRSEDILETSLEQYREYANYLYENDKEKTVDFLMELFTIYLKKGICPEGVSTIFKEPWVVSCLSQYGTLALKFERSPKDNLDG